MFKKIRDYLQNVRSEMSKVVWPSKDELRDSTIVVIVLCLLLAIYVFGIDAGLSGILKVVL